MPIDFVATNATQQSYRTHIKEVNDNHLPTIFQGNFRKRLGIPGFAGVSLAASAARGCTRSVSGSIFVILYYAILLSPGGRQPVLNPVSYGARRLPLVPRIRKQADPAVNEYLNIVLFLDFLLLIAASQPRRRSAWPRSAAPGVERIQDHRTGSTFMILMVDSFNLNQDRLRTSTNIGLRWNAIK